MTQPTLKVKYAQKIVPLLQKKLGYKSRMQVPKLLAIHLNQGVAEGKNNPKAIEASVRELTQITGQKAARLSRAMLRQCSEVPWPAVAQRKLGRPYYRSC